MIILDSLIEGAQLYSPKQRGDIYRAIVEYSYYGIEPDYLKGPAKGFFVAIKPNLDMSRAKAEAGRKGGKQSASKREANAKQTPSKREAGRGFSGKQTPSEEEEEEEIDLPNGKSPLNPPCDEYAEIVGYLNAKAGTAYKPASGKTRSHIHARLAEGFAVEDFKRVIDGRVAAWGGDPKMAEYLRPETLFGPKFEGYLNAKGVSADADKWAKYR